MTFASPLYHMTDVQIAFLAGLIVGEGSFTGDPRAGTWTCAVKMSARHEHLLRLVHSWCPLSRFYRPYPMPGHRQDQSVVHWRGPALVQLIRELEEFGPQDYCPHVYSRMMTVKAKLEEPR